MSMPSNSLRVIPPNPTPLGGGTPEPHIVVDALTRIIRDQFPAIVSGAAISAALVHQVADFLKENLAILLGGVLTTAGLAVLLPSLAVVLVNLVGFSASGVVYGSLATVIQSWFYGGSTSGAFAMLQSFGATAVVAPPVVLALGGTLLVIGAGAVGYWLYQRRQRRLAAEAQAVRGDDSNDDDEHPPKKNQPLIKRSTQFNIFDIFRRSSKY